MPKHPQRFWTVALIVGWLVDFLFWDKPIGVSFFVWVALAIAGGLLLARYEGVRMPRRTALLVGLLLLCAGFTLLRAAEFPRLFNSLLALAGLILLIRTFRSGGWTHFSFFGFAFTFLEGLWFGITRALGLRLAPEQEVGGGRAVLRRALPYLRGVLLALPVLLLFGGLLASADLVFAGEIERITSLFALERWPEYIFRLLMILVIAYVLAGLYAQAIRPQRWLFDLAGDVQEPAQETAPAPPAVEGQEGNPPDAAAASGPAAQRGWRFLGAVETFMVLGSVDLLFLVFVAVQFRYFFGGQTNITAAGFTYADYARRGFFELVAVAVFSLLLYLLLNAIMRRGSQRVERWFTVLASVLVGSVLVILVSAFQRLLLYEGAYGFTQQRTYTHIFIPWLAALLVGTIALQIFRREQWWGGLLVLVLFGFAASLALINIDGLIARENIARAVRGEELDGYYLLELSDDALPALVQGYRQPETPQAARDLLGAALACKVYRAQLTETTQWQSYHPGRALAWQQMVGLDLRDFPVRGDAASVRSVMVDGSPFYCFGAPYMD